MIRIDIFCCFYLLATLLPAFFHDSIGVRGFIHYNPILNSQGPTTQKDRERIQARQQFNKSFRDLQVLSQGLLREHESKRLTPGRLAKDVKSINKCAKNLRTLIALGNLASEKKVNKEIDTPGEFDESIRQLAKLIWDFAHNSIHQNNKVFNMDEAARAQTDLLTIINLSKAIEDRAKNYRFET